MAKKPYTILHAKDGGELWIKGSVPGRLYGTIKIIFHEGPKGFGVEINNSVGDATLTIDNPDGTIIQGNWVHIYELLPEAVDRLVARRRK
jgi:hypothetical protein